jgi:hypothetical protein
LHGANLPPAGDPHYIHNSMIVQPTFGTTRTISIRELHVHL